MKIFVLEDNLDRIQKFRQKLHKHSVTYCDYVEDAKKLLEKEKYDVIFFDHDLDNRIMVDSDDPNTGYQLAKWIRAKGMKFDQIVIHTCNPIGGDNIQKEIEGCSENILRMPFPILIEAMEA